MITVTLVQFILVALVQGIIIGIIFKAIYKKVELAGPLMIFKSKKGLKWIEKQSKRFKRFWPVYGSFGIILAFGFLGALYVFRRRKIFERIVLCSLSTLFLTVPYLYGVLLGGGFQFDMGFILTVLTYFFGFSFSTLFILTSQAITIIQGYLTHTPVVAMVGPAIPGVNVEGSPIQDIPWYGWFAFPILVLVHEFSHGIVARFHRVKVKSTGVVLLGILPLGAFVEPDDKQLKRAGVMKRLNIFSVGSTANYLTSVIVTVLLLGALHGVQGQYERYVDHPIVVMVSQESDAMGKLEQGMKILSINGMEMKTTLDINEATQRIGAGNLAVVETDRGTFNITLNENAKIGIQLQQGYKPLPAHMEAIQYGLSFLYWVAFFNLVVGIMNLLPVYPLDGGYMLQALIEKRVKRRNARKIVLFLSVSTLLLFIVNLVPLIIR